MSVDRAYAWRSLDGPQKGESSWSIIHKFCLRNAINSRTLVNHINSLKSSRIIPEKNSYDLRFSTQSFEESIIDAVKIVHWDKNSATLDRLTGINDVRMIKDISSSFLRYCPICILHGFHAACMQLLLWNECPIHQGVLLMTKCQKCNKPIPYTPPRLHNLAYRCQSCGHPLWVNTDKSDDAHSASSPDFKKYADVIFHSSRLSLTTFGFMYRVCISDFDLNDFIINFKFFLRYSTNSIPSTNPPGYDSWKVTLRSGSDSHEFSYKKLYKHIRKQIERHCGISNNLFFRLLCNTPRSVEAGPDCHIKHMRHYAYAQWRVHWESTTLRGLAKTNHRIEDLEETVRGSFDEIEWGCKSSLLNPQLKERAQFQMFCIACRASFMQMLLECTSITHDMWVNGAILPEVAINKDRSPFFIISDLRRSELTIHWFLKKELTGAEI